MTVELTLLATKEVEGDHQHHQHQHHHHQKAHERQLFLKYDQPTRIPFYKQLQDEFRHHGHHHSKRIGEPIVIEESPNLFVKQSLEDIAKDFEMPSWEKSLILNALFPPLESGDDKHSETTQVSLQPATEQESIDLQISLEKELEDRFALPKGVCPSRHWLYKECFDELIRQVLVESPERGILLARIRDEGEMTLSVYQSLTQASLNYGQRLWNKHSTDNSRQEAELSRLNEEKEVLLLKRNELVRQGESDEKRRLEETETRHLNHADQVDYFTHHCHQLKFAMDKIVTPATKKFTT